MKQKMKKLSLISSFGIAMMAGAQATQAQDSVVSAGSCLNVRSKANSRSSVKFCASSGTPVKVLRSANAKFSYVEIDGKRGYVFNKYLKAAPRPSGTSENSAASFADSSPQPLKPANFNVASLGTSLTGGSPQIPMSAAHQAGLDSLSQTFQDSIQGGNTRPSSRPVFTVAKADAPAGGPGTGVGGAGSTNANSGASTNGNDLNALSWDVTKVLERELGKNGGYSLSSPVGWAKLSEDGSISVNRRTMHCTSATHAHFLKMMGELHKKGLIQLNPQSIKALNSDLFRDAWNSNGYANGKLMEMLGGQNFKDIRQAKAGDFLKMDRSNGSGHTVIFSHLQGDKVCFWSGNRRNLDKTSGLGVNCESLSGKTFTLSRITDLQGLQAGLDNLANDLNSDAAFADVRRRGGNGFVKRNSLEFTQVASAPPSLSSSVASAENVGGNSTGSRVASRAAGLRQMASAEGSR